MTLLGYENNSTVYNYTVKKVSDTSVKLDVNYNITGNLDTILEYYIQYSVDGTNWYTSPTFFQKVQIYTTGFAAEFAQKIGSYAYIISVIIAVGSGLSIFGGQILCAFFMRIVIIFNYYKMLLLYPIRYPQNCMDVLTMLVPTDDTWLSDWIGLRFNDYYQTLY